MLSGKGVPNLLPTINLTEGTNVLTIYWLHGELVDLDKCCCGGRRRLHAALLVTFRAMVHTKLSEEVISWNTGLLIADVYVGSSAFLK